MPLGQQRKVARADHRSCIERVTYRYNGNVLKSRLLQNCKKVGNACRYRSLSAGETLHHDETCLMQVLCTINDLLIFIFLNFIPCCSPDILVLPCESLKAKEVSAKAQLFLLTNELVNSFSDVLYSDMKFQI